MLPRIFFLLILHFEKKISVFLKATASLMRSVLFLRPWRLQLCQKSVASTPGAADRKIKSIFFQNHLTLCYSCLERSLAIKW